MAESRSLIDRLSSLPDSVLCHIMSFLPTRTSVATMTLVSRRWLHLWKDLQAFHFYGRNLNSHSFKRLLLFVNAVLSLRKSRDIRNFHLNLTFNPSAIYDNFHLDCIRTWILAAIGPHLQQLSLDFINSSVVVIPPSLFTNCTNLISLSLVGPICTMDVKHSSVHFPLLKMLSIGAEIVGKNELVYFLSGCPKLETLEVCFYFFHEELVPKVLVENSKSANDNFTWTYFDINEGLFKLGIVGNFHSMLEAFLDVFSLPESEFVDPILNNIIDHNSEFHKHLLDDNEDIYLELHHSASKWPCHAPVLNYPEFRVLHHLKFILPCFNSNLLVHVLGKCHLLQVLIIQSNKEEPPPLRTWQPESTTVSECLKSHLTYVHIEGYQGLEDELAFAEYILRNGLVLKTMLIYVDISMDKTDKDCSFKRLTNMSKGSVTCKLKFDVDGSL